MTQGPRQTQQRRFAGGFRPQLRVAIHGFGRYQGNQCAGQAPLPDLRLHDRNRRVEQLHGTVDVDARDVIESLPAGQRLTARRQHTGRVHQQVDATQQILGGLDDARAAARRGQVDDQRLRAGYPFRGELGDCRVFRRTIHRAAVVHHQHLRAEQGQRLRSSEPDAARGPGHNCPPVV
jgi:hypothetical protein